MPLSNEDSLRLNVLLAQNVSAIRIDEGKLLVLALTAKGEARIQLNPNIRNEKYIKEVKDFLSTKALGAPGGFPMFISRWNRMGDLRNSSLDKLLLLGEEEAVAAVVNNKSITADLAKSAWWCMQSADNARSMLANAAIVQSEIGKELAQFLVEFLPFEQEPLDMLVSTRLVLQADLISNEEVAKLWNKAKSKNTLYVGFLDIRPDNIPQQQAAHPAYEQSKELLSSLLMGNNPYALGLCKLLSAPGQTFLKTAELSFKRIPNYDIAAALLESIRRYVYVPQAEAGQIQAHYEQGLTLLGEPQTDVNELVLLIENIYHEGNGLACSDALTQIKLQAPDLLAQLKAILFLSRASQTLLAPTIANSTAVGSLMRKKLKPVFEPVISHLRHLQS